MSPVIQCCLKHWMRGQQLRRFIELFAEKVYQDKNQPLQFKFNTVKTSTARPYTLQNEVQVLRLLSCQLYYHLKSIRNIDIREIEVLYVLYQKEAKYMFFATNPLKDEDIFSRIQNEWEQNNLQVITTSPHKPYGEEDNTKKKQARTLGKACRRFETACSVNSGKFWWITRVGNLFRKTYNIQKYKKHAKNNCVTFFG